MRVGLVPSRSNPFSSRTRRFQGAGGSWQVFLLLGLFDMYRSAPQGGGGGPNPCLGRFLMFHLHVLSMTVECPIMIKSVIAR